MLEGSRCIAELSGSGQVNTLFGVLGPVSRNGQWFTPDGSGSIASVTDGSGNPIAQNCYGAFGQVATNNPNSGDPLQFMGGMADPTSGLDTIGSTNFSPSLGMAVGGNPSIYRALSPAAALGQFGLGIVDCARDALLGFVKRLNPFDSGAIQQAQSDAQLGLVGSLRAPVRRLISGIRSAYADYSSPRAAGRSVCSTVSLVGPALAGGGEVPAGGAPPGEVPPTAAPPTVGALPQPQAGDTVFRVWGNKAGPLGQSWTPVDPRSVPDYRSVAGLPNTNSGEYLSIGALLDTTNITVKPADSLDGNPGGLAEWVIPDPASQIGDVTTAYLNPPL